MALRAGGNKNAGGLGITGTDLNGSTSLHGPETGLGMPGPVSAMGLASQDPSKLAGRPQKHGTYET